MPGEKRLLLTVMAVAIAIAITVWGARYLDTAIGNAVQTAATSPPAPNETTSAPAANTVTGVPFAPSSDDTQPPAPPTGLTVTDPGTGDRLLLQWNANTEPDLLGYRIYRAVSAGVYAPPDDAYQRLGSAMVDTTQPSFTDTSVSRDVYYFYRITAVDQSGNESLPSNPSSTFATDITPPAKPAGFKVKELDTGHDVELSWQANTEPDLAGYQLYRATSPAGPFHLIKILGQGETVFHDTDLTQGQWYYYYLVATDEKGNASQPTEVLSVQPRQAVRAEFNQENAVLPATIFIEPDSSALFLNLPGDRIRVRARAVDEKGEPVPLAGTIRFAAAFGEFRDPVITGDGTAEATFTADRHGSGEIAVEYYPEGADVPAVVDTTTVRALEWYVFLSASGNRTVTGSNDIKLTATVTDQNGQPVTDWRARVVFETVDSPTFKRFKDKHHPGRWQGAAHANVINQGRTTGVSAGRVEENGEIKACWVASTTPGTTRVQAVLYYDDLRGPDCPPKRICASGICTVEVVPGPARYVGFDPAIVKASREQRVTVQAFDAFGNPTTDYGDLKVWVKVPDGASASFSLNRGETWYGAESWVAVKPGDRLLIKWAKKGLPADGCILVTRAEGLTLDPPPGVPQVNLPLRIELSKNRGER